MFKKKSKKLKNDELQEVEQSLDSAEIVADMEETTDSSIIDADVVEVDEDLGTIGYLFDVDTDTAIVDEEAFDTLVDAKGFLEVETNELDETGQKIKKKVKARRGRAKRIDFSIGIMTEANYGELLPLIKDANITDINWNGAQLWVDDVRNGRYLDTTILEKDFVDAFSVRVSNVVSKQFNKYMPILEAETEELRITILHESVSHTGRAISIRKTPAIKRINFMESIRNGSYCSEEVANIMSNSVKAKMNIVVCGLPGVGKTELAKFLTNYIFPYDRVITIEDTLEIHYKSINPDKDCLEMKVSDQLGYTDAIKTSLRLLPQWILLSEARSVEVKYLLESVSTGAKCITTLHTDDVRKIPDRIVNMAGSASDEQAMKNSVYSFFDIGILIGKRQDDDGKISRWIEQICTFDRSEDEVNKITMIVENGQLTGSTFSDDLMRRFKASEIADPFQYTFLKEKKKGAN